MNLQGHSVWVLGAGFLGSALAGACRTAGARVLTIDPAAVSCLRGTAADLAVLEHALERLVPDIVYCCTATRGGSAEDYRQAYLAPVLNLAQLLRQTRVVFCSSTSVYGACRGEVVTEATPPRAESPRAGILLQAERVVLESGGVVARLAPLFGPGRCELLRRYFCALPGLPGSAGRLLNYLHRDDAVQALLLLGIRPWLPEGVFNVSGECFARGEVYAALEAEFGIAPEEESMLPSLRGVSDMLVDCSLLRSLGWCPRWNMLAFAHEWRR